MMGYNLHPCDNCCCDEFHCPTEKKCPSVIEYQIEKYKSVSRKVAEKTGHPMGCECILCALCANQY